MKALHAVTPTGGVDPNNGGHSVDQYVTDMRIAGYSPVTISDRRELIERFRASLEVPLLQATAEDIRAFQARFVDLAPASANIYARHLRAFFTWAAKRDLIDPHLPDSVVIPRVPRGRPHPTRLDDLRIIFACATGALRLVYALAAFAGLRRGEICQLQRQDIDLDGRLSTALINGKGGKQRTVPLLAPVVDELMAVQLPRSGWVIRRNGGQYSPKRLSIDSHYFLADLGVATTLHSMRSTFATQAAEITHDAFLIRDLLGHASVSTTEIYVQTSMRDVHMRLAGVATLAEDVLSNGAQQAPIRAVAP